MEKLLTLQKNLQEKGYDALVFNTKEEADKYLNEQIDNKSVGIGGSQTVKEMGLYDSLAAHNEVYWHAHKPDHLTEMETRQAAVDSEVYIISVNGVSMDGIIINIDAVGNRIAGISFGPKDVYFVIGKNKIAQDYDAAMYRARNVAAPKNAQRLNKNTPCAANADKCYDCKCPERICRNFSVLRDKPFGRNYHIIIINEELGY